MELIKPIKGTELDQLITNTENPSFKHTEDCRGLGAIETNIRSYLATVLSGPNGQQSCPFVKFVEASNGYYLMSRTANPEDLDFEEITLSMNAEFINVSPKSTYSFEGVDPVTIVTAFTNQECLSTEFGQKLDAMRNKFRQDFLDQGLMLAQMHAFHERGGKGKHGQRNPDAKLYSSEIPLLMVRRMHKPDRLFMNTPEEIAAYKRYFPLDVDKKYL